MSARCHVVAEIERGADAVQRLPAFAGTVNGDVAVVQQPAENRLVDIDAFHLVHVHFDRVPLDEAALVYDAPVGHVDLGGPAPEPGLKNTPNPTIAHSAAIARMGGNK